MRKIIIILLIVVGVFLLISHNRGKNETMYNGNEVTSIELGVNYEFTTVSEIEQQKIILTEINDLNGNVYTPDSTEINVTGSFVFYSIKLTYSTGDGCVIDLDFENNTYQVSPVDQDGNVNRDDSTAYQSSANKMEDLCDLFY